MDNYIGAKIIKGEPMDELTFRTTIKKMEHAEGEDQQNQPGYHVVYEDGYESWSPKATFENAYRLITPGELVLITNR
ncbi:hypothetical protein LCGC14_0701530 [marine sediment metagenome]|uniref:Uncharacterized protein n=1 Tax=marine sediment metagenome TaxID=412755 RepID=A0A0F9QHM9_9ZZZZ